MFHWVPTSEHVNWDCYQWVDQLPSPTLARLPLKPPAALRDTASTTSGPPSIKPTIIRLAVPAPSPVAIAPARPKLAPEQVRLKEDQARELSAHERAFEAERVQLRIAHQLAANKLARKLELDRARQAPDAAAGAEDARWLAEYRAKLDECIALPAGASRLKLWDGCLKELEGRRRTEEDGASDGDARWRSRSMGVEPQGVMVVKQEKPPVAGDGNAADGRLGHAVANEGGGQDTDKRKASGWEDGDERNGQRVRLN